MISRNILQWRLISRLYTQLTWTYSFVFQHVTDETWLMGMTIFVSTFNSLTVHSICKFGFYISLPFTLQVYNFSIYGFDVCRPFHFLDYWVENIINTENLQNIIEKGCEFVNIMFPIMLGRRSLSHI